VVSLFFFVLLALGFIFLNRTIAQKAWRPFEKTLGQLKSFDLSATETIDFEKTEIQEFEDLHNTLQKMLYAAISAYKQQKTFIENASHELQTPLAILRSKVDLFYQLPELNEAQLQVLEGIEKPLARVSRINKNLLLLAKIENHQFEKVEILDWSMINDILELLQDYAESKNLTIQVRLEARPDIKGNKFLIETLLYNLLTNAIRYTSEGEIVIFLDSQQLSVQNTGIISLNPAHIFRRFSVSSSEQVSSGLGLAIAKEICHRYNWKMEYALIRISINLKFVFS
jgi:signal transduction histidine kinase